MPHIPDVHAHATHDPELVAAHASGDATGADLETAAALVAGCAECGALHRDLRAIAAALPAMPAPVRRRDFRLTPGQAASLRPAGWRRLAGLLSGPRFSFAAPLGAGLATLGLAVLLLSGPGLPIGMGGAASADRATGVDRFAAGGASPAATPAAPAVAPEPAATTNPDTAGEILDGATAGPVDAGTNDTAGRDASSSPGTKSAEAGPDTLAPGGADLLPVGAVAVAVFGAVLVLLRLTARRIA
jgi:hypothetical protein